MAFRKTTISVSVDHINGQVDIDCDSQTTAQEALEQVCAIVELLVREGLQLLLLIGVQQNKLGGRGRVFHLCHHPRRRCGTIAVDSTCCAWELLDGCLCPPWLTIETHLLGYL